MAGFIVGLIMGFVAGFAICVIAVTAIVKKHMLGYLYLDITGGNIKMHMLDYPDKDAKFAIFRIYSQNISSPK